MSAVDRYQTVLLFGAPGAGKGTQGKILAQVPGFYHLSTGEMFRNLDVNSDLGRVFSDYSTRGELVPDDFTIRLWSHTVHALIVQTKYKPREDILILDGIPRNVKQAQLMHRYIKVLKVIHLVCPDKEEMISRLRKRALRENRADDAREDVIRRRWDVYEQETYPVLGFYPQESITQVNAVGSPARVMMNILEALVPVQDQHFKHLGG